MVDEPPIMADEELVAAALAGDAKAFEPIVRRYQEAVFGVALARVRDFHAAEDIAQSVFIDAFTEAKEAEEDWVARHAQQELCRRISEAKERT